MEGTLADRFFQLYQSISRRDLLEIGLLAVLLYVLLRFIGATRGVGVVRGLGLVVAGFVLLIQLVTAAFDLSELNKILDYVLATVLISFIVIFQPELRSGLFALGRNPVFRFFSPHSTGTSEPYIDAVAQAAAELSRERTGALLVIERSASMGNFIRTGELLDANITSALLITIFQKESPLHDGAVILSNGRIAAAGCQLPLSEAPQMTSQYGMRHRAAIGITEETDAIVLVVSEETGRISIVNGSRMEPVVKEQLANRLHAAMNKTQTLKKAA